MITADFKGLNQELLSKSQHILAQWFPNGVVDGSEFKVGDLDGGPGKSLCININTGLWADFATGESGSDLIDLYARKNDLKQIQAYQELSGEKGTDQIRTKSRSPKQKQVSISSKNSIPQETIIPPPVNSKPSSFTHAKYGPPEVVYKYLTEAGNHLFFVARYKTPSGKTFLPFSYSNKGWINKSQPEPRPLYGLEHIAQNEGILIIEGEKAVHAAREITEDRFAVVTWPGGSKAVSKVDWSPLYGKRILIWPDADLKKSTKAHEKKYGVPTGKQLPYDLQPGYMAGVQISNLLFDHCPVVKIINTEKINILDGWDAADAAEEGGFGFNEFKSFVAKHSVVLKDNSKKINNRITASKVIRGAEPIIDLSPAPRVTPPAPQVTPVLEITPTVPQAAPASSVTTIDMREVISDEVTAEVKSKWCSAGLLVSKGTGRPFTNLSNITKIINFDPSINDCIWYDDFYHKVFIKWDVLLDSPWKSTKPRAIEDIDATDITCYLQDMYMMREIKDTDVRKAMDSRARRNRKNAPREWMESLKWDGVERVKSFFQIYMGCRPHQYTYDVAINFWVGMIARVYQPGCKLDNMVILEGIQGKGKSMALSIIGGDWYLESNVSVDNKDFLQTLVGKLLVEIAELDSFSNAKVTRIKTIVSTKIDEYRPPYGRYPVSRPRQCILVGTTNDDEYLRDSTGNRRFWPVKLETIKTDLLKRHRDQLFAEAIKMYKDGVPWYKEPACAQTVQADKTEGDIWEDSVNKFLGMRTDRTLMTMEVLIGAVSKEEKDCKRGDKIRMSAIMKKLGWEYKTMRDQNKAVVKRWRKINDK